MKHLLLILWITLVFTWQPPPNDIHGNPIQVDHYNLYRTFWGRGFGKTPIKRTASNETRMNFLYFPREATYYDFAVTVVDSQGRESDKSNRVTIKWIDYIGR